MLVRGSRGKKAPYGRVRPGDALFFATGSRRNVVKATALALAVLDSPAMSIGERGDLLAFYNDRLLLSDQELEKWSGKRYLTLIGLMGVSPVVPFSIAARGHGEDDDWLVLEDIDAVIE